MRIAGGIAALAVVASACELPRAPRTSLFGFTTASTPAQLALEKRFLRQPDPERLRSVHRELTRKPHIAGSPRDRELAEWTARQFTAAGMQDVRIVTHEVMLPRPLAVSVEMTAPAPWRAAMRESPVADPDTHIDVAAEAMPYHAYSASGEVTAPVVFAGDGDEAAYEHLAASGIDVRGTIVLVEHSNAPRYSYRGYKAFVAQQKGAAGILMFSDPAKGADPKAAAYPDGPSGPDTLIERGGIIYDFVVPGDPLTPGWASVPGSRRIAPGDAPSLPRIVSIPLSARDARPILAALAGPPAPSWWRTSVVDRPRLGPGRSTVRMTVRMDDSLRPVWTVTGTFRGSALPDEVVIVGNHRDAWVYGGVDPSSGSAALVELARGLGALTRQGWRPRRSIMFASWDAEEFALTSSTEWVEQHDEWLRERAVAYINVDSAASGPRFNAGAVPSLTRLVGEAADAIRDPHSGIALGTLARDRAAVERRRSSIRTSEIADDRLGGGSDYVPFVNFAGVPSADIAFDGPHGVYHSIYDTHQWITRFGDPGFRYHVTLVQLWGVLVLRLAQADILPIDPETMADRILEYVDGEIARWAAQPTTAAVRDLRTAASGLKDAALAFSARRDRALAARDSAHFATLNRQVMGFERTFIDRAGLEGRAWYRHLIYAPDETYAPTMVPGLKDAGDRRDRQRLQRAAERLTAALRRAAQQLGER